MLTAVIAAGWPVAAFCFLLIAAVVVIWGRNGPIGLLKPRQEVQEPDIETVLRARDNARKAEELRDWDRQFRALLPPELPCTSTAHDHEEVMTWGGHVIGRYCR